eukprot:scaffold95413_cov63-Phaeocystis_antarctica.AAC.5
MSMCAPRGRPRRATAGCWLAAAVFAAAQMLARACPGHAPALPASPIAARCAFERGSAASAAPPSACCCALASRLPGGPQHGAGLHGLTAFFAV